MKIIVAILLILSLLISIVACTSNFAVQQYVHSDEQASPTLSTQPSTTPVSTPIPTSEPTATATLSISNLNCTSYKNENAGYSIDMPKEWSIQETNNENMKQTVFGSFGTPYCNISAMKNSATLDNLDMGRDAYLEGFKKYYPSKFNGKSSDVEITKYERIRVPEGLALHMISSYQADDIVYHDNQYLLAGYGNQYNIRFSYPVKALRDLKADDYLIFSSDESMEPVINKSMQSFKFLDSFVPAGYKRYTDKENGFTVLYLDGQKISKIDKKATDGSPIKAIEFGGRGLSVRISVLGYLDSFDQMDIGKDGMQKIFDSKNGKILEYGYDELPLGKVISLLVDYPDNLDRIYFIFTNNQYYEMFFFLNKDQAISDQEIMITQSFKSLS